jgi:hypothetical protein
MATLGSSSTSSATPTSLIDFRMAPEGLINPHDPNQPGVMTDDPPSDGAPLSGLAYQWFRNSVALSGETGAILLRNNANAADSGSYAVRITNSSGSVTTHAATITLSPTASRPANISVRTNVATDTLVPPASSFKAAAPNAS